MGITLNIRMLCFVLINSVILNFLCVRICYRTLAVILVSGALTTELSLLPYVLSNTYKTFQCELDHPLIFMHSHAR